MSNSTPKLWIIANPTARRGKQQHKLDQALSEFHNQNIPFELSTTEYPGHAGLLTEQAINHDATTIIAAGGDGTVHEVLNGIMFSDNPHGLTLGTLPAGTGNVLAYELGLHSFEDAVSAIVDKETSTIDIGKLQTEHETRYFHNLVGFGVMSDCCKIQKGLCRQFGALSYHAAFLSWLPSLKHVKLNLQYNSDDTCDIETTLLAINNSKYTGHKMNISPRASVFDGLLDLLYCEPLTRFELIRLFMGLNNGTHLQSPRVFHKQVKSVIIQSDKDQLLMIDGELMPFKNARVEIIPSALKVFTRSVKFAT